MDRKIIIKAITKIIRKYLSNDYGIFLFGSLAKDKALENSDIDIGILGKEKIPWEIMTRILEEVEKIPTLRKIDIVDLNSKEESFRNNVLSYAEVLS